MNFLGLGFSLGSEDKGLGSSIKSTVAGMANISLGMAGVAAAAAKMVIKLPDTGPMRDLVKHVAGDVKTTTTQLEAYGVAASKVTSAGMASLNMSAKEFSKAKGMVAGIAFGMNTDIGGVTKSFVALKQANVDVTKVGFKSFAQFQKVIEVTGADSAQFASSLGTMSKQMGMNDTQIKNSIQSVAAIGKKFNIGREAIAGMSDTVKLLNEQSNRLPQNWGPDRMAKFLQGTTIVAGALTSVGVTADDAMDASRQLTSKLLEGETGLAALYSGVSNEIPDIAKIMNQHMGKGAGAAFEKLQESPEQFLASMGNVVKEVQDLNLDPQVFNRFRLQMEEQIGPKAMAAFTEKGFGQIGPAIAEGSKAIADQGKVFDGIASKYEDGRTHAERFAIEQDRVQTKLKKVQGVMGDGEYLASYTKQSKLFIEETNKIAGQGGVLGKLTSALIDVKMRGLGGAIAAHSKFGFAIHEAMEMAKPFMAYLPMLGAAFTALASPIGLVAGLIGGLFFLFKDLEKGEKSIVRPMIDKLMAEAPALIAKAKDFFMKALGVIGKAITYVFEKIDFNQVGQVLGTVFSRMIEVALVVVKAAFKFGERLAIWLSELDWGAIGAKLGYYLAEAFDLAATAIWKVISNWPQIMSKVWRLIGDALVGALDGIRKWLVEKFPSAVEPITTLFDVLKGIARFITNIFSTAWKVAGVIISESMSLISDTIDTVRAGIEIVGDAWDAVSDAFSSSTDSIFDVANKQFALAEQRGTSLLDAMSNAVNQVTDKTTTMEDRMNKALRNMSFGLVDLGTPIRKGFESAAKATLESMKSLADSLPNVLKGSANKAAEVLQKEFNVTGEEAMNSIEKMASINPVKFKKNMESVKSSFIDFLRKMDKEGMVLMKNTTASFNTMWETMDNGWKKNQAMMTTYVTAADGFLTKFWKLVVDKSNAAKDSLITIAGEINKEMSRISTQINVLDLLASKSKIEQWATSVAAALASAMRGGKVADAAFGAAFERAFAMGNEFDKATPDDSPDVSNSSALTSGAAATILDAINNPSWTRSGAVIPSTLLEIQRLLENIQSMTPGAVPASGSKGNGPHRTGSPRSGAVNTNEPSK